MGKRNSAVVASAQTRRAYKRIEAAERIGIDVRTLDRLVRRGELQVLKIGSTRNAMVLIEHDELERFIVAHRQ